MRSIDPQAGDGPECARVGLSQRSSICEHAKTEFRVATVHSSVAPIGEKVQGSGYGCALLSHRLAPKDRFPAQAEDVAAAFAWIKKNIEAKGGDPKRVILIGHGSGPHLSLLIATDPSYLAFHKLSCTEIAAVVGLSTPVDLTPRPTKKGFGDTLMAGKGADVFSRDPAVMKAAPVREQILTFVQSPETKTK
jgi:acetyl esterase/lipase